MILKFEFICADHPDEVLDYQIFSEGEPCQIAIESCTQCFNDLKEDYKLKVQKELKEKIREEFLKKLREVNDA